MLVSDITAQELKNAARDAWSLASRLYNNPSTTDAATLKRLHTTIAALHDLMTTEDARQMLADALKARENRSNADKRAETFETRKGHKWSTLANGFEVYLQPDGGYAVLDPGVHHDAGPWRGYARKATNSKGAPVWRVVAWNAPPTMAGYVKRKESRFSEDGAVSALERLALKLNPKGA